MVARFTVLFIAVLLLTAQGGAEEVPRISHGPMLGAVSENSAAIWFRTSVPGEVTFTLLQLNSDSKPLVKKFKTSAGSDNTCTARFGGLKHDTKYQYAVLAGDTKFESTFMTLGPSLKNETIRIVYGYGYKPQEGKMEKGTSIFTRMSLRRADAVLFLGDFPYTKSGRKDEIRKGNKELRSIIGFRRLTARTPTYGIYDDHDFGPNDCDGRHINAEQALAAFKEYWPNPSYGLKKDKGIYCSFVIGNVEIFLLDGRYPSRQVEDNPTMLGKIQYKWLCNGLLKSKCRYKVLVSGTPFARVKRDCWGGEYFTDERDRLFKFIYDNNISGVIGISGDIHRCDIHKLPIGENRFFYDFTSGALARVHRSAPKTRPATMIYSYGDPERNMFGEIDFHPASDKKTALVFRSFSGKTGLTYEHKLSPGDLGIKITRRFRGQIPKK